MLEIKAEENICIVRLTKGVTNPICLELIHKLDEALRRAEKDFSALIITGGEKFFSMGFDLPELIGYKDGEMRNFYRSFNKLILKVYDLSIPTCAMISGHAVAGGFILVLSADFRTASIGKKLFLGVNEIKLGVPVPFLADLILRQITSHNNANYLLYSGEFINPLQGKETGIINEIFEEQDLELKTLQKMKIFASLPRTAFSAIKRNKTRAIIEQYLKRAESDEDEFIQCWFSENTRRMLEEAAKKF